MTTFTFGTVGSPISTPKKPGGSVGSILHSASLKMFAYELAWVQSVRVTVKTCAEIKETAAQAGVGLSIHAPYFINLNADAEEWPKSRKRLMDAAHYGNLAGATDIIFHPGSYFGRDPVEVLKIAIPRLRDCVKELRDAGNNVTIRPETMGKGAMLGSLDDTIEMSTQIAGVLPCIDFAHLHAREGKMNSYDEWDATLKMLKKKLGADSLKKLHIHLSGIEYGEKGEKNHLEFKKADLKYKDLLKALHDNTCGGRILCESPIMEEDAKLLMKTWGRMKNDK